MHKKIGLFDNLNIKKDNVKENKEKKQEENNKNVQPRKMSGAMADKLKMFNTSSNTNNKTGNTQKKEENIKTEKPKESNIMEKIKNDKGTNKNN